MVQYYTLREAAEKLGMDPDKLKEMAKTNQLRAFQDRGTLRFRAQEIDELARSLGLGSDPELQIREQPKPASKPPSSGPKSPPPPSSKSPPPSSRRTMHIPADADMSLVGDEHDAVPIGNEPASPRGSKPPSSKSKPNSKKPGVSGSPSPSPAPAHDSDVRLVSDSGDLDFKLEADESGRGAQTKEPSSGPKSPKDAKKRPSKLGPEDKVDSGVRVVPLDKSSDSDVKIVPDERAEPDPNVVLGHSKSKTPSDSDVRLEPAGPRGGGRGSQDPFITEDVELDLEALKQEESKTKRRKPSKSTPALPTTSPFELAEEDATDEKPKAGKKPHKEDSDTDSSSDFELTPTGSSEQSPIELGSDEMPIPLAKDDDADDAQVVLGEISGPGKHDSGINLRDPKDSGISLEEGGSEEIEFEPSPDGSTTPKHGSATPKPKKGAPDSSGEFELSLDDSPVGEEEHTSSEFELTLDTGAAGQEEDSSSEFDLSLDPNATSESSSDVEGDSSPVDSDSEFELSLDASGELETAGESGLEEGEKDIFETDFEVPALDEESGSEAVDEESDTDLEGSDFELDLSDEDLAAEEDSGSQVVALEEDEEVAEADEEHPPSRKPRKKAAAAAEDLDEPLIDLEEMEEEEAEAEVEEGAAGGAAAPAVAPAPWGVLPAIFLVPSFIVLFFVVIMSFELLHNMWGYHTGGYGARLVLDPLARLVDDKVP